MDGMSLTDGSLVQVDENKEEYSNFKEMHETSDCTSEKNPCGQNVISLLQGLDISLRKSEFDGSYSLHKEHSPLLRNFGFGKGEPLPHIFKKRSNLFEAVLTNNSKIPGLEDSTALGVSPTNDHFCRIFQHVDNASVTEWLKRAYISMAVLRRWCHTEDNFARFAHFWLSDIPYQQMLNLFNLEVGIIEDELYFAFRKALYSGVLRLSDLQCLRFTILSEYPAMLTSRKGQFLFLDYLILISSEHTKEYKNMISSVKNTTNNPQITQVLLAMRAFALSSVWHAVVQFYETFVHNESLQRPPIRSLTSMIQRQKAEDIKERALQSVQLGYVDVLNYLIKKQLLDPCILDESKRNLIFLAVIYGQPKILDYLYEKVFTKPDVNQAAENGNTPLHAAVTVGNTHLVSMLLCFPGINVNALNHECGGATALHLAVTYGHMEICVLLVEAGADTEVTVEGATPAQMAHELGHEDIAVLIKHYTTNKQYYK
ncbi:salivary gland specific protein SAGSIN1 isoform X1 [Ambystoma mexicanum]|uniref:salivary gland specific protein SAGSIN1 isoform X1 n=1 Tax=Ambystoma mexicanum TaxID=8296 RepID=UPI0037E97FE3